MSSGKPTILIVDDEAAQRKLLRELVESISIQVCEAGSAEEMFDQLRERVPELILLDVRLPGTSGVDALPKIRSMFPSLPVILITAYADLRQAVAAGKLGATDYLAKPLDLDELRAVILDTLGRAGRTESATVDLPELPPEVICCSKAMRRVLETAALVSRSDVPVLIGGESGVGKEIVARLIHHWSSRSEQPLVVANCAGLPETLAESTLFGHTRGAFTGASESRSGLFRAADGGTLFLDEIGELSPGIQAKLLRTLESGDVVPVGSDRAIRVDVRVLAATNRNLNQAAEEGRFREDLLWRINVIELVVPPLRERAEDILPLARHFAQQFVGGPVRLSPQATQCLLSYSWPGNVRQLRNAVHRACLLCRGDVILPEHLPAQVAGTASRSGAAPRADGRLSQVERATILATLAECGGNRTQAAKKLGISRRALIYKLRQMEDSPD